MGRRDVGGSPKRKGSARECDKISPKGRMSTRFERSQKVRKKSSSSSSAALKKLHSCKSKCRSERVWQRPSEIDCPSLPPTFILLTHVPQLATETLLTALSVRPSPNWRILPCRPITYCSTATAADSRVVKQDNKRPNSDGYNSRRR